MRLNQGNLIILPKADNPRVLIIRSFTLSQRRYLTGASEELSLDRVREGARLPGMENSSSLDKFVLVLGAIESRLDLGNAPNHFKKGCH